MALQTLCSKTPTRVAGALSSWDPTCPPFYMDEHGEWRPPPLIGLGWATKARLRLPDLDEIATEPPVPPQPQTPSTGGGWEPSREPAHAYLDEDGELVILNETEVAQQRLREHGVVIEIRATSLQVEVRATMLPVLVVERGNLIFLTARFLGDPDEVNFVYTVPGGRPIADPGFGRRGSSIERLAHGVYHVVVDTTGFHGGAMEWHFWGEGEHQASEFGTVQIPFRSAQLL